MDKKLIMDICDRIATEVTALKTVDIDFGQLSSADRPGVAFPCCLVDISYSNCSDTVGQNQTVRASITIRMAYQAYGKTGVDSPNRADALKALDTVKVIHAALQGWDNEQSFDPISRTGSSTEKRGDGLRVYRLTYETSFIDDFNI